MVTFITFGGLSVFAALLALLLPETGEENLPDTVREAETLGEAERMAKHGGKRGDYDDNTLVRSDDCAQTQYSEVKCTHRKDLELVNLCKNLNFSA